MPELRWILLVLGALFVGVLAFWEIRRKRHARGQDASTHAGRDGERVPPTLDDGDAVPRAAAPERPRADTRGHREPTLTFPDVHLDARGDRASVARPPVVEIDEESLADLKIEPHTVVDEFSTRHRNRASDEALGLVAPTIPIAPRAPTPREPLEEQHRGVPGTSSTGPRLVSPAFARPAAIPDAPDPPRPPASSASPASAADLASTATPGSAASPSSATSPGSPASRASTTSPASAAGLGSAASPASDSLSSDLDSFADSSADSAWDPTSESPGDSFSGSSYGEPSITEDGEASSVAASMDDSEVLGEPVVREAARSPALTPDAFETPEPIVDWPTESSRKIIALRLICGSGERFQGRAVRQALAAEGFQIGKFEIFHKPGPDARAVLSAASLTKPGTFSLNTMDGQRYGGLSLFAVLPGPLSPVETFDELLLTARSLNDRLRGALQDERGEPLTPTRSASIRDNLASSSTSTTAH